MLSRAGLLGQDLEKPEATYRKLGAKLVVGMPFKDQATSDTLLLPDVPAAADTDKRRALARLQVPFASSLYIFSCLPRLSFARFPT